MLNSKWSVRTCKRGRFTPMRRNWESPLPFGVEPRLPTRRATSAVLWLLAIALCGPFRVSASDSEDGPRTLTVEARDLLDDSPVPDVSLDLSVAGGAKHQAVTNENGLARFEFTFPDTTNRSFFVTARGDDLVPLAAQWIDQPSSPTPPGQLLFQTEKATTIGGRVLDEDDQPLADAAVVVSVKKKYPRSEQWVTVTYESTRTDADGRWNFTNVPEQPDSIEIGTYHPLCLTDRSAFYLEPFQPRSALRDGSAVLRLRHGTLVEGTVLSPDGEPLAGAEVFYGEGRGFANAIPPVKADARGRFTFGIKPGTSSTLIARAPSFGPTLQRVKVGDGPLRVYLTLEPAHSVRGRIVDPSGNPIARAHVRVFWSGSERPADSSFGAAIAHELTADKDGRFRWEEAPASAVHASISAAGFAGNEDVALVSDADQEIVLIPPTTIQGTVVDDGTGQPLPRFSLALAAAWNPGDPFIWQSDSDLEENAREGPGAFEHSLFTPAHRYLVRVHAEGYLPEDSERFSPDGTAHSFTFRLTRAEPIRGAVRNPDGTPARDGFVYLVPPHHDGWIEYLSLTNGDVSEHDRSRSVHARIGADGRFSLPPQRENFTLLALTDAGRRSYPVATFTGMSCSASSRGPA